MTSSETYALFWDHVEEFRSTLIRIFGVIAIGILLSFACYGQIISFLINPLTSLSSSNNTPLLQELVEQILVSNNHSVAHEHILPQEAVMLNNLSPEIELIAPNTYLIPPGASLIYAKPIRTSSRLLILGPLEGMEIAIKTSIWLGVVATSPLWLLLLLQYITPALHKEEKRLIIPFLLTSLCFITSGCIFAFFITIPLANAYFTAFNQSIGFNMWSLSHYLNYTLFLLLANGLAFEFCVLGIFAVHLKLITADGLAAKRRFAVIIALILGALLTPPDVLTQLMLAIPLIILYECVILYARIRNKLGLTVNVYDFTRT